MSFTSSVRTPRRLAGSSYVCWRCSSSQSLRQASIKSNGQPSISLDSHDRYSHNRAEIRRVGSSPRSDNGAEPLSGNWSRQSSLQYIWRKSRLETSLRAWESEYLKSLEKDEQQQIEDASPLDLSSLTQLIMKTKEQRVTTENDDVFGPTEKYPTLEDLEDAEPQKQFFDDSVAFFEEKPLQPGDLVDFARTGLLGVYIKHGRGHRRNATAHIYVLNGDILEIPERIIDFRSAGFVTPDELEPILPFIRDVSARRTGLGARASQSGVPRELGGPIIAKVLKFKRGAIEVERQNAIRLDNCVKILAKTHSSLTLSTSEAAREILAVSKDADLTEEQIYAVHLALVRSDYAAVKAPGTRFGGQWVMMPQDTSDLVRLVMSWWHAYLSRKMNRLQPDLQQTRNSGAHASASEQKDRPFGQAITYEVKLNDDFGSKDTREVLRRAMSEDPDVIRKFISSIRTIVSQRREKRPFLADPAMMGPVRSEYRSDSVSPRTVGEFDPNEAAMLRFLLLSAQKEVPHNSSVEAITAMLIRETGLYPGVDYNYANLMLLQELGIISPWEVSQLGISRRLLPGYNSEVSSHEASTEEKAVFNDEPPVTDGMQALRHDWGNLDVYCVDDAATTTIDDGISIERIKSDSTQIWIHVHVANPTAFLNASHPFIKSARAMGSNVYLPNVVYGMMNPEFIASLGSLEKDRPCLTFSTRLNENGDILEDKISPGYIRNVSFLTPSVLSEVTSQGSKPGQLEAEAQALREITVGLSKPLRAFTPNRYMKQATDFTDAQIDDLKTLHRFTKARLRQRSRYSRGNTALFSRPRTCSVEVYDGYPLPPDWTKIREIDHDPTITLRLPPQSQQLAEDDEVNIVEESMLLAGTGAAAWCARRGIPAPYRVATSPEGLPSREQFFNEFISPLLAQDEPVPRALYLKMIRLAPSSMSIAPRPHDHIGVPAYMRVTSPLRRFTDVLSHFQIEAALRFEASRPDTSQKMIEDSKLAFTASQMAEECRHWAATEQGRHYLSSQSRSMWILRCLARALHFGEAALPESWTIRLAMRYDWAQDGRDDQIFVIDELGILCQVQESSEIDLSSIEVGSIFEGKLISINMDQRLANVRLLEIKSEAKDFIDASKFKLPEDDTSAHL